MNAPHHNRYHIPKPATWNQTMPPNPYEIRVLETPAELSAVEELQHLIWPGDETEIVPVHMLRAVAHNGGFVIGAFDAGRLVGFVFGFPGLNEASNGPRLFHASHMAGVHPNYRDAGLGFLLKRAQWQMVRQQNIDRITWTYDPLQSRNANLNIAKLGAVCNTYIPNFYGEMRDELNVEMPSDRFRVDWWVNSHRVQRRLGVNLPRKLDLAHYLSAETPYANRTRLNEFGLVTPVSSSLPLPLSLLLLLEIPADITALKFADLALAQEWSHHIRSLFLNLFAKGYLVTDFVFLPGTQPRSFYVLSNGEATF